MGTPEEPSIRSNRSFVFCFIRLLPCIATAEVNRSEGFPPIRKPPPSYDSGGSRLPDQVAVHPPPHCLAERQGNSQTAWDTLKLTPPRVARADVSILSRKLGQILKEFQTEQQIKRGPVDESKFLPWSSAAKSAACSIPTPARSRMLRAPDESRTQESAAADLRHTFASLLLPREAWSR